MPKDFISDEEMFRLEQKGEVYFPAPRQSEPEPVQKEKTGGRQIDPKSLLGRALLGLQMRKAMASQAAPGAGPVPGPMPNKSQTFDLPKADGMATDYNPTELNVKTDRALRH